MTIIKEIEMAIKTYAKGIITEAQCVELFRDITNNEKCPVIDVFGLGPEGDPEAYGLPSKNNWESWG